MAGKGKKKGGVAKEVEVLMAIHHRQELRQKLIDLDRLTCQNCRNDRKRQRVWAKMLEQVLYKKRKGE